MSKMFSALVLVGILTGCVSKQKYDALVVEQQRVSDAKDSAVSELLATTQMITEINTDLAQVKSLGVSPTAASGDRPASGKSEERAIMLGKVREIVARLTAADAQIEQQKKRVAALGGEQTKLLEQLTAFQASIAEMKTAALAQEAVISDQKTQIRTLASRIDTFTTTVATMTTQATTAATVHAAEKAALKDTLTHVIDEANVVYYVVGTKDELLKQGVVTNEGSKFLFFGAKTLQPSRILDPKHFKKLDLRRDTVLTVPQPAKSYAIVTRQSPKFLASTILKDGTIKGDLHITSAEFWQPGKFLILVEK